MLLTSLAVSAGEGVSTVADILAHAVDALSVVLTRVCVALVNICNKALKIFAKLRNELIYYMCYSAP